MPELQAFENMIADIHFQYFARNQTSFTVKNITQEGSNLHTFLFFGFCLKITALELHSDFTANYFSYFLFKQFSAVLMVEFVWHCLLRISKILTENPMKKTHVKHLYSFLLVLECLYYWNFHLNNCDFYTRMTAVPKYFQ